MLPIGKLSRGVLLNRDADHHRAAVFFAAVAADEQVATRHRYVMLSTTPAQIPDGLRAQLVQLNAPISAKPVDVDALLAAVREAASPLVHYLSCCPGARHPSHHDV